MARGELEEGAYLSTGYVGKAHKQCRSKVYLLISICTLSHLFTFNESIDKNGVVLPSLTLLLIYTKLYFNFISDSIHLLPRNKFVSSFFSFLFTSLFFAAFILPESVNEKENF